MDPAPIWRKVNGEAIAEANKKKKLLMLNGITCVAQLKIKKLKSWEIIEITKRDWGQSVSKHNSKLTECPFPNCEFQGNGDQLILHKLKSHRTITPYKCEQPGCKYESNKGGSLANHTRHCHSPQHRCTYNGCGYTAKYEKQLKIHLAKMHNEKPYVCETCPKGFKTAYQLGRHMNEHFKKKIPCTFPNCNYEYFSHLIYRIKDHMMTHTGEKPFKCPHCCWRTQDTIRLKRHMQRHESNQVRAKLRIFKCTWENCNFSSNQRVGLRQHLNTHLGIKPFQCTWPECFYRARDKHVIKRHMKSHAREKDKPYVCTFCNVSCSTSQRLVIHVRRHTGEKPFKCPYPNCDYSTSEPGVIKRHINVRHNEEIRERSFTCGFCQKSYMFKKSLEDHMRTHTGEQPYNCQYCRRAFYYNSVKYSHEKICKMCPVGKLNKPFKCSFLNCNFETVWKINLKRHENCVHSVSKFSNNN